MIHINEIGNYVALDATSVSYLRWIASPHRQIKIGDPAFAMCNERKGYLRGRFFGKLYRSIKAGYVYPASFDRLPEVAGMVVVAGADLRLNGDRRVPTPRFTSSALAASP